MRGITLRNLDIIHFTMTAFLFEPGEEMWLEDVTAEDVRVNGEGQSELIRLKPVVNQYMRNKVPGHVSNIRFRNLSVSGKPGPYRVQVIGADEKHDVRDVVFQGVEILGSTLGTESDRVEIGQHATEVRFEPKGESRPGK